MESQTGVFNTVESQTGVFAKKESILVFFAKKESILVSVGNTGLNGVNTGLSWEYCPQWSQYWTQWGITGLSGK